MNFSEMFCSARHQAALRMARPQGQDASISIRWIGRQTSEDASCMTSLISK
jgi:hypothetical protein